MLAVEVVFSVRRPRVPVGLRLTKKKVCICASSTKIYPVTFLESFGEIFDCATIIGLAYFLKDFQNC